MHVTVLSTFQYLTKMVKVRKFEIFKISSIFDKKNVDIVAFLPRVAANYGVCCVGG